MAKPFGCKVDDATLPRKSSKESFGYPYRKPTQVGEERILRCLREFWLRNSANWPRNFGIRGAFIYEGRSEKGVATVY